MHNFYSIVICNIKIFQTCIFIMIIHWLIYVVKNDLDTKVPCNLFYSHSNSALRVFHKLRHLHKNHICRCNLCCKNHQHILQKSVLNSIYQTSNEFLNNHFFITNILQRWTQILLQNPKKKGEDIEIPYPYSNLSRIVWLSKAMFDKLNIHFYSLNMNLWFYIALNTVVVFIQRYRNVYVWWR